jgi:predicted tellurium resistance membrane protein TerC
VSKLKPILAVSPTVSRLQAFIDSIYRHETALLEDLAVSLLLFVGISVVWEQYAPTAWPQLIYYVALAIALFGYFQYASPAETGDDEG